LTLISLAGLIFLTTALFVVKSQNNVLQAKLATQTLLTEQYIILANSRKSQLDELHALIIAHNARLAADEERLENYQYQQGELADYISSQMADTNNVCLDNGAVERLRQIWQAPALTRSN